MLLTCDYAPSAARWIQDARRLTTTLTTAVATVGQATMEAIGQRMDDTAPVDTGALRANRSAARTTGPLTWQTGYDLPYAPILEYGGYLRVGPKTVALGGGDLGEGFVAGAGIYAKQTPLGWVRKALASQAKPLRRRLATAVQTTWGGGALTGTGTPLTGTTQTLSQVFGVEIL